MSGFLSQAGGHIWFHGLFWRSSCCLVNKILILVSQGLKYVLDVHWEAMARGEAVEKGSSRPGYLSLIQLSHLQQRI